MRVAGLLICQAEDASERLDSLLKQAMHRARQSVDPKEIREIL